MSKPAHRNVVTTTDYALITIRAPLTITNVGITTTTTKVILVVPARQGLQVLVVIILKVDITHALIKPPFLEEQSEELWVVLWDVLLFVLFS